jgi:isocitrate lyase
MEISSMKILNLFKKPAQKLKYDNSHRFDWHKKEREQRARDMRKKVAGFLERVGGES